MEVKQITNYINVDTFLNAQIAQVNITTSGKFELIPTIGNHIILLGDARNLKEKFDRLFTFYTKAWLQNGINNYEVIDVRFNNQILQTPNLDAFYKESVRFTDFHVSPTCAPTRSALLTGRHEFKNGVTHTILERERLTLRATTLAQVLKRAGYTTAKFFGMVENIDDNFGATMRKLDEWGLAENTLVVFLTDNGGTAGVEFFNAGLRGGKNTPYQGGTRVPSFWRWPAGFRGGVDCAALAAHLDIFPTLAEIAGVRPTGGVKKQVEGRSLLPLLRDPAADWPDRFLVTHIGRWERGQAARLKYDQCSIRNHRFTLVNDRELYDLRADPGESRNVLAEHPGEVAVLRAAYDEWWKDVLPRLVNETAVGPKVNPFKELYWKQFGGGPDPALPKL